MDKLRDFLKSWPGRILLILCLSPLALLGIESYFAGSVDPNQVAQVGEESISMTELQSMATVRRNELLEQVQDASLINENVLLDQVLKGLVDKALLEQQIMKLGMTVSDETINRLLLQEPGFQGADGQFSNERFAMFLQQQGMNKDQLFAEFRDQLSLTQLNASIVGTSIYPMSAVSRMIDLQMETRNIWLHRINWQDYADRVTVSAGDIEAYYDQNQEALQKPATVDLAYIQLTPSSVDVSEVSEEDIAQQYEAYKQANNVTDVRELSQILLTGENAAQRAQQLKTQLDGGASFAALAREHSDDPTGEQGGAIGRFNPTVFGADAATVESALEGLDVGDVSEPVQTSFGYQIFTVTANDGAQVPTLESLRDTLTAQAQEYKRQEAYNDKVTTINNLVADGVGIAEIAQQEKLQAATLNGYTKENNQTPLAQPAVINAAFDEFNIQDQAVSAGLEVGNGTVWVQPSNYQPTATLTLEEATPQIQAAVQQQKATALAMTAAQKIAGNIKAVDDIAAQAVSFDNLGETSRQSPVLNDSERSKAFSEPAPEGGIVAMVQETDDGVSVIVADAIKVENKQQLTKEQKQQTAAVIRDNMGQGELEDYLEYLRMMYEVDINEEAISSSQGS